MSVYSDLNRDYFVVSLRSEEKGEIDRYREDIARSIELRIVSNKLYSRQFARIWVNGSAVNSTKSEFYENTENFIEFARCIKGNLVKGDRILIDFTPKLGTSLYINGTFIHTFAESSFFNLLLSVLIGEVPLSSRIKRDLLAFSSAGPAKDTQDLYASLTPTASRMAITQTWAMMPVATTLTTDASIDSLPEEVPLQKVTPTIKKKTVKRKKPVITEKKPESTPQIPSKPTLDVAPVGELAQLPSIDEDTRYNPFTIESLLAERDFLKVVTAWVEKFTSYPVLVADRPEEDSIRFTITLNNEGDLTSIRQFEKSKFASLNKGAIKLIEKSNPFPPIPIEIQDDSVDLDLYFYLHWRYKR